MTREMRSRAASAMQQTVHRHNDEQLPGRQQHLRVGLHVGEAIRREGDYFGTAVVVARRLCDSAQGGQVLASAVIRDLSGPVPGCSFRTLEPVTLKGFSEPFAACEVLWEFVARSVRNSGPGKQRLSWSATRAATARRARGKPIHWP